MIVILFVLATLSAQASEVSYIVHWTSDEPCFECPLRHAMNCRPGDENCNIPKKTVDHFEVVQAKPDALKIANEIADTTNGPAAVWTGSDWTGAWSSNLIAGSGFGVAHSSISVTTARPRGKLVAIYEAHQLPVEIHEETVEVQQPPKTETKRRIWLKDDRPKHLHRVDEHGKLECSTREGWGPCPWNSKTK